MSNYSKEFSTSLMTSGEIASFNTKFIDFANLHPKFASLKSYFSEMTLGDILSLAWRDNADKILKNLGPYDKFLGMLFFETVGKILTNPFRPWDSWCDRSDSSPEDLTLIESRILILGKVTSFGDKMFGGNALISDEKIRELLNKSDPIKRTLVKRIYVPSARVNCDGAVRLLHSIKTLFENLDFVSLSGSVVDDVDSTEFKKLVISLLDSGIILDVRNTPFSENLEKYFVYTKTQTENLIWNPSGEFITNRPDLSDSLKEMISKRENIV